MEKRHIFKLSELIHGEKPDIHNGGYNTFRDLFSSEYGALDKINFFRGIVNTFNSVYPQLYDIDLRRIIRSSRYLFTSFGTA